MHKEISAPGLHQAPENPRGTVVRHDFGQEQWASEQLLSLT